MLICLIGGAQLRLDVRLARCLEEIHTSVEDEEHQLGCVNCLERFDHQAITPICRLNHMFMKVDSDVDSFSLWILGAVFEEIQFARGLDVGVESHAEKFSLGFHFLTFSTVLAPNAC